MSTIEITCPDGLTEREIAAFRLGSLCVLLATKVYLPGTTRRLYENEIHRHKTLLGATVEVEL
jgi:hypothetical protein